MAAVKAVLDNDLSEFLDSIGVLGDIKAGRMKCKFCDEVVTLENLHAIFPDSGNISVICSDPECVKALNEYLYEREALPA